jgi:hypothetical protein
VCVDKKHVKCVCLVVVSSDWARTVSPGIYAMLLTVTASLYCIAVSTRVSCDLCDVISVVCLVIVSSLL